MILKEFENRFSYMKRKGINIQYVLDIGAYRGDFTETILNVWPTSIVRQFEADERQKQFLKNAYICLLGNKEGKEVDFYTLSDDKITTGSSIYKENTKHYNSKSTIVIKKIMTTLDTLNNSYNFYGQWEKYGLIKLDTQGSELLILEGAKEFIDTKKPRFILIECSIVEYNIGAPKILDVMLYMKNIKYEIKDIINTCEEDLLQVDILFEREKL